MATVLMRDTGGLPAAGEVRTVGVGMPAHAELGRRVDQIARDLRLLSIGELSRRADAIRGLAQLHGMAPVARIAGGLADALAIDGRGAMVRGYCDALRDMLAGDPYDGSAGDAFLAAVSVRLG